MSPIAQIGFPVDGGEMGRRIREKDWSQTPLGPIEGWPQSLRTAVDIGLNSAFPTFVWWGPDLIQIYNDATTEILRAKHPAALGQPAQECWAEIWPDIAPLAEHVITTGEAERREGFAVTPDRGGPREPAYFDFCYSAIRDESGSIAGMFITSVEITNRVHAEAALRESEERQTFLLKLSDALRPLADPAAIKGATARVLGEYLRTDRTYYGEIDHLREVFIVERDYVRSGVPSVVGQYPFAAFGLAIEALREGRPIVTSDARTDPSISDADRSAYAAISTRSFAVVPIVKGGVAISAMAVAAVVPRKWTREEVALLREVADRTWSAVERARAEEALRHLNETLERRVEERTRQVRSLASMLTKAEQAERRRVSQILHDDLQQVLYGIQMRLDLSLKHIRNAGPEDGAVEIETTRQWIEQAIRTTRQLTVELSPPILKGENLTVMLLWLRSQMRDRYGLRVDIRSDQIVRIPGEDLCILLFHLVRELLFNVAKHADTGDAVVVIHQDEHGVRIDVNDEGCGFVVQTNGNNVETQGGLGIFSVRERLNLLGGHLEIDSKPDAGTRVTIYAPFRENGKEERRGG